MAKDGEDDANDREKGATGFRGQALAQVVLEMVTQAGFFPALGQHNPAKAVGLQHQLQARKPPSAQLDILDNLISPFLLLAAAEKMHHSGTDLTESCAGPLPMYEEVSKDLATLIQLFQAHTESPFVALLQSVRLVVELRLGLCQWYLLHVPLQHRTHPAAAAATAVAGGGLDAQAAWRDPLSALTPLIQRLKKEESSALIISWKDVVLAEAGAVVSSLQTLALLSRCPSDLLAVTVELLRLRKALRQWDEEAGRQPPVSARGVVAGAARRMVLRRQLQHLVNKLPLRFHGVAEQVMDLSIYNTALLGLPYLSSSSSSSSRSNPYVGLIAQFLLSYGPTAQVCVALLMKRETSQEERGAAFKVNDETQAYASPPESGSTTDSPRQEVLGREFVPVFSMTSGQAAAGSSTDSTMLDRPPSAPSSLYSSHVAGAAAERGGWFWELCHHSGLWPAVQGRLPEGGAQRFSLLGAGAGGGGGSGRKSPSPLAGTFIHQSGRHTIFTYFVAHVSPQERLVVAFGDRTRPATDRVVLSFLMTATPMLDDSVAFAV